MEQKKQDTATANRRGSDMSKIEQIRRRRHEKRLRTAALLVLVLAAVLAYLGGLFAPSINFLSELLDTAQSAMFPGEGWPMRNDTQNLVRAEGLVGGAALLDQSDLVLYSPSAKELRRVPHGYADPAFTMGNARVCIYNRGGKELKVESRSRNLLDKTYDYPIITVGMSDGGAMAVATKSERYLSEITVYDASFNESYYCYLAEEYPVSIHFASDGKRFAAACMQVSNGDFGTKLRFYDIREENQVAEVSLPGAVVLDARYLDTKTILVVSDRFVATYDCTTGAERARYDYGGQTLLTMDIARKNIALVFGDEKRVAINRCTVIDSEMQPVCNIALGYSVKDVMLKNEAVYVLNESTVREYDLLGVQQKQYDLETKGSVLIDAKHPLVVTAKEILQLIE